MLDSVVAGESGVFAPASSSQARTWFIDQVAEGSAPNNLFFGLRLEGALNIPALELALRCVIGRHEVLRTTFELRDGRLAQLIHGWPASPLHVLPCADESAAYAHALRVADAHFDLSRGPLLRLTLLGLGPERHVLVVTAHHIIADAWSLRLLMTELSASYAAFCAAEIPGLPPVRLQYADYAAWQAEWLESGEAERQLAYWRHALAGLPALSERPERPGSGASFAGASAVMPVPAEVVQSVVRLAAAFETTPYAALLAVLHMALWQRSGEPDAAVGIAVAGRGSVELEQVLGPFANIVPVRAILDLDEPFADLLRRVRGSVLEAISHQELPLERLVDALHPVRNAGRTPIFDVLFTSVKAAASSGQFGPLRAFPYPIESSAAAFDLSVALIEEDGGTWWLRAEYRTAMFTREEAVALLSHCLLLTRRVADRPEDRIGSLPCSPIWNGAAPRPLVPAPPAGARTIPAEGTEEDEKERLILRLWEEALGRLVARRDVSFFDYGGHSLMVVALAARLAHEFGHKVPVSVLLEEPTVAGMARQLNRSWQQGAIFPVQPGGSRPPLFCAIPNGTYRDLSRALGHDQPVYLLDPFGLQERRLLAGQAMLGSVEAVAATFVAEVVRVHPAGPVLLGGMCGGGVCALEVALQLQALGREVALLAQFDTPVRGYWRRRLIDRLRRARWLIRSGQTKTFLRRAKIRCQSILQALLRRQAPLPADDPYELVWSAIWRQMRAYQPARRFEGRVELFRARRREGHFVEEVSAGWAQRASLGVRVHDVPGEHNIMLQDPITLQRIGAIIEQAGRGYLGG